MQRKHRLPRRFGDRPAAQTTHTPRNVFHYQGKPLVVKDWTGVDVLRIGAYGLDGSFGDDDRGVQFQDSSGNSVGEVSIGEGVSFGQPIIGSVISDNIVSVQRATVQQFIDFTNGSDSNDGLAPVLLEDSFSHTAGTQVGGTVMSDTYHTWALTQGIAANATWQAGPIMQFVEGASVTHVISAQAGAMFEEQIVRFQVDKTPTGAAARFHLWFRLFDKGSWASNQQGYLVRFIMPAGGGVVPQLLSAKYVDGTSTNITAATNVTGDPTIFAANTDWKMRAQVYYNYLTQTTTIRARAWKAANAEPTTWDITDSTDIDDALFQRGGSVGLGPETTAITNPNITFKVSAWSYQLLDPDKIASDDGTAAYSDLYYSPASTSGPVQSLGQALRALNQYNQGYNFLFWHNGSDLPIEQNTHVDGFVGSGSIFITGAGPTITGGLSFNGNSCFFHLGCLVLTDSGGGTGLDSDASILVNCSRHVEIHDVRIHSNSKVSDNVKFHQGSEGSVYRCQLNGAVNYCVEAREGSVVKCNANAGTGATNAYRASSSVIFMSGQAPNGGTSAAGSGKVFGSTTVDAPASAGGGSLPPTSSKVTKSWAAAGSATYGMQYGTWSSGEVTQGSYGGSQNHKGLWRYPAAVQSTLSGKTINAAYITIRRASYGGSSGQETIYLCSFNTSTLTGDPGAPISGPTAIGSLAWGQTKTFKIPSGIINDLKTASGGSTRCLGVFIASGNPYAILTGVNNFSGSGRLKVTYT